VRARRRGRDVAMPNPDKHRRLLAAAAATAIMTATTAVAAASGGWQGQQCTQMLAGLCPHSRSRSGTTTNNNKTVVQCDSCVSRHASALHAAGCTTEVVQKWCGEAGCDGRGVCVPVGARGDGRTDDTAAVQAALNSLSSGQTLLFPPGLYLVANLTVPDVPAITLRGSSRGAAILKLLNGSTGGYVMATHNWVADNDFTGQPLSVVDLVLQGPADGLHNGTVGLILMAWSSRVAGCQFLGFEVGLQVTTSTCAGKLITTTMVNNRYERCEYLQNSGNGFEIKDSSRHKATDYFLLDSFAMYNGGNGFRLDTTAGGLIRGNHMYSNRAADISINIASQSLRIVENYMEDNFAIEIQTFNPHESVLLSSNVFEGMLQAIANDGNATLQTSNNVFRTQTAIMSLAGNRGHWLSVLSVGDTFVSSSAHYQRQGNVRIAAPQMQWIL
jgi:hypothetical protein